MNFEDDSDIPFLDDEHDSAILMHRDAHFLGNFNAMLEYYSRGGKGVQSEFEVSRILHLKNLEEQTGENLALTLLTAEEQAQVLEAKLAYKKIRETKSPKHARLIAELILSEEELFEEKVSAIVSENKAIVKPLLDLVKKENFYNPLFPGFGKAPFQAIDCLGKIGDPKAVIALFETIGSGDFFDDDITLNALKQIGEPAKQFLLRVLKGKPINEDNERAAIALIAFKKDPEIGRVCYELLMSLDLKKEAPLATYLILGCSSLKDTELEDSFLNLITNDSFSKDLKNDIKQIIAEWKN